MGSEVVFKECGRWVLDKRRKIYFIVLERKDRRIGLDVIIFVGLIVISGGVFGDSFWFWI